MENRTYSSFISFNTLFKKEVLRFWSVSLQTIMAPVITGSLYLLIFGVSLGGEVNLSEHFTYVQFVVPGLILMGVMSNSFQNTSSSLFFSRYLGNIVDLLVTPITPGQFITAYTLAAMLRGLVVGFAIYLVSLCFTGLPWVDPGKAVLLLMISSFLFAQFGLVTAIFSTSFDTLAMYSNFLILPLIYLGGLFYPISRLPPMWANISQFNPLFYLIDGFRGAILGHSDSTFAMQMAVSCGLSVALFAGAYYLICKGYKLRS